MSGALEKLMVMSLEDLLELNKVVVQAIKLKQSQRAYEVKRTLRIGDEAEYDSTKMNRKNVACIVKDIRLKQATVELVDEPGRQWNVPLSMLRPRGLAAQAAAVGGNKTPKTSGSMSF